MAGVSFGVFYFVVPALWGNLQVSGISANVFLKGLAQAGHFIAIFLLLFFLVMAALSLYNSFVRGKKRSSLFNKQKDIETLRSMSWQDFEKLVGEVYRKRGYTITETGGGGADGGVDLVLKKNGETIFVQCKHWKMDKVGVIIIRELLGVVYDKKASGGIVITSGTFTQEAINTARGNPIELVNGKELLAMISRIKTLHHHPKKLNLQSLRCLSTTTPHLFFVPYAAVPWCCVRQRRDPQLGACFTAVPPIPSAKGHGLTRHDSLIVSRRMLIVGA
jgi:restriction system protein